VLGANITTNGSAPIVITGTVVLDLNGYTITSTNDVAIRAYGANANLTINGNGSVVAQEACVMAFYGAVVTINGGTYTSYDNFVVGTNGTVKENDDQGHNTITINGGTFIGGIQTAGYIACGVYVANSDTVVLNGGTFNITDGLGILARSGNTTVGEDVVINVTNENRTAGWIGDKKKNMPAGAAIVWDLASAYPGGVPSLVNNSEYEVVTVNAQ